MIERTLSMIKPDATKRSLTGKINALLEEGGLRIIAQKRTRLTKAQAQAFYAIHHDKPFFDDLVSYMSSGPIIAQILEGEDAVKRNRELMGATNPKEASKGTIRALFAQSIEANSVHGSDSVENAQKEIAFFFKDDEIFV